jgi:hypothetical protein
LRVKKSVEVFAQIFDRILKKIEKETGKRVETKSPFAEITEEDIEKLFG